MRKLSLHGRTFGRLLVVAEAAPVAGLTAWRCACNCGNEATVLTKRLRNGRTKSCGCLHVKHALTNVAANERPIGHERIKKQNGYVEIKTEHGFRRKHVFVMERHIGRRLAPNEVVHHADEDKTNNSIENLVLMTHGEHTRHHNLQRSAKSA